MTYHPALDRTALGWLLGDGSGTRPRAMSPPEAAETCRFLRRNWRILPLTLPRLLEIPGAGDDETVAELADIAESVQAWARLQIRYTGVVATELDGAGVPYALLKASALRSFYPCPERRGAMDIDIAVPAAHLRAAEEVARAQGFLPAAYDRATGTFRLARPHERAIVEAQHYELAQLVRRQRVELPAATHQAVVRTMRHMQWHPPSWHLTADGELACYLALDVHHGLSPEIPVTELVAGAQPGPPGPGQVRLPPTAWLALHLIYKIYWEGVHSYRKGGYQYADLIRILPHLDATAARELTGLLRRYHLVAAGYYVLRRLVGEFGLSVDAELEAFLEEAAVPPIGADPLEANDLGDMWPKLWGLR